MEESYPFENDREIIETEDSYPFEDNDLARSPGPNPDMTPFEPNFDEGSHGSTDGASSVYEVFPPAVKRHTESPSYVDYRSHRLQRIRETGTWLLGINMSVKSIEDEAKNARADTYSKTA